MNNKMPAQALFSPAEFGGRSGARMNIQLFEDGL